MSEVASEGGGWQPLEGGGAGQVVGSSGGREAGAAFIPTLP